MDKQSLYLHNSIEMDIKCALGLLILLSVRYGQGVSKTTIVHFRCCNCAPQPNDCCVGALILPNVAITTAFCTDQCQKALIGKYSNVSIVERYSHKHYRNFLMEDLRHKIQRNDVGLVSFDGFGNPSTPYLKLSAVVSDAAFGLAGLIPVIDDRRPRLVKTIVQRCQKHSSYSMGYVICTVNKVLRKSNTPCQQQQGVPLLVDGKIIGLTGFVEKTMCENEQKYFLAIGPSLPWIRTIVTAINSLRNPISKNKVAILRGRETSLSINSPETDITNIAMESSPGSTSLSTSSIDKLSLMTNEISTTNITSTKPTTTTERKVWSSDENVSENEKTSTLNLYNKVNLKDNGNLTNAMEWFNNNVRNKLNRSVPLLVLTTPIVNEDKFVDLT